MTDTERLYHRFGKLVRRRRHALGWTQEQLADKIGLSRTSVTNIELGRQKILFDQFYGIARALRVRREALLP